MKTISYNPTNSESILLAGVASRLYPQATILVSEKTGSNFKKILEEANQDPDKRYAVILLDEGNEEGLLLELAIVGKYHDFPSNFQKQFELSNIFNGDKMLIKENISHGRLLKEFLESPFITGDIKETEQEELPEADTTSTADKIHPPHLEVSKEATDKDDSPVDFNEFVSGDPTEDKKEKNAAATTQGTNIDAVSEAEKTTIDPSDVVNEEEETVPVDEKVNSHIDDVSIQEEQPVIEESPVQEELPIVEEKTPAKTKKESKK